MRMIRRGTVLVLAMLLLAAPARAASGTTFVDVPRSSWAYENVRRAAEYGLVGGVGDDAFGLGRQVTRAQYATMLCRLMGWEMISPARGSFDDNQDKTAWYYSAVETAYAHGALPKLSARAGVNEPLPREEMATMTVRALGYASLAGVVQDDCPFTDVTTNRGYIALAYHMGFMGGVDTNLFSPKAASTREQAATVLLRAYDRLHADVAQASASAMPSGAAAVWAEPLTGAQAPIPMNPRAPLENVYDACVKAGVSGAVALHTAPCAVTLRNGTVSGGRELTQAELSALLSDDATRTYRSARYGSSYLVHTEPNGSTVVWYETAEDVAAKLTLCRLMGVKTVYVE